MLKLNHYPVLPDVATFVAACCDFRTESRATIDICRRVAQSAAMEPTTGRQLRVERVAAGLTVNAVVAEMGISRQTMWATERRPIVDPEMVAKYRAAIARLVKKAA